MKRITLTLAGLLALNSGLALAQTHPAITSWLRNTTHVRGRHYNSGNPSPIADTAHANVQRVRYSASYAYVNSSGIPAYVTGPFLDGNRATATNRNFLFKFPLAPRQQTGTPTSSSRLGNLGVFINGVPIYNYLDGNTYNNQGIWHQNAVMFENTGFDCAKGHASPVFSGGGGGPGGGGTLVGGTYHHHQNPSAFNIATVPMSTVCNMYLADGLYVPDSTRHGPLIGFAFDGYPIYGGYGYANPQQAGPIKRMTPGYRLRNITARTTLANGTQLTATQYGPSLATRALGYYGEDYEYVAGSGDLDDHNGRFCVTPEYPNGTYAYFATIDRRGNSVFPYLIGSTYYGVVETSNFAAMGSTNPTQVVVNEPVQTYTGTVTATAAPALTGSWTAFPSPAHEVLVVQVTVAAAETRTVELLDLAGRVVARQPLYPGSTMCYFPTQTLTSGAYLVRLPGSAAAPLKVVIE